ncbi:hypothetical protein [Faecalibacter bovis]|uniref:Ricin B lectin domain-containing protein n=1 Tax=Faecalibacter bovis TaxID=2898187 RepID=A0ABX7XF27_9FLAO|nr:hypothetical protein [Faecalibacter bovis]QTV06495.1 hypothetical protein J9309_04005 [Faecalibacter bovis]
MKKYIFIIIGTLSLINSKGQNVGIGLDNNAEPEERLHVKSVDFRGMLHFEDANGNIIPYGDNTKYLVYEGNGQGIGWENISEPYDFASSTLIKNKILNSDIDGITIRHSSNTSKDELGDSFIHGNNASNKQWKMLNSNTNLDENPLVSKVRFTSTNSSINATIQTMVLKYSTNNDQTIVSYTCGFFIKKANNHNINEFKLFHIRPEVITGPPNSFKLLTMSGMIKRQSGIDGIGNLEIDTDYYITPACRGRNIGDQNDRELLIGKSVTSGYTESTRSILTPNNVQTSFVIEQVEQ